MAIQLQELPYGWRTCIFIRDTEFGTNIGNVVEPEVSDYLLIMGAYKNPVLVNNNLPSSKYVMGSYFCGAGVGRDNRVLGI